MIYLIQACKEKVQSKLMKAQGTLREMTMKHSADEQSAGPSAKRLNTRNPVYCQGMRTALRIGDRALANLIC